MFESISSVRFSITIPQVQDQRIASSKSCQYEFKTVFFKSVADSLKSIEGVTHNDAISLLYFKVPFKALKMLKICILSRFSYKIDSFVLIFQNHKGQILLEIH